MNRSRRFSIPILSLLPALLFAAPALAQTCLNNAFSQTDYTVNADGTVTDTVTDLIWDQCSWGQTLDDGNCTGTASTHNWRNALGVAVMANNQGYKGHDDRRLPNRTELESLVDPACHSPAINTVFFPGTPDSFYWSSTSYAPDPGNAWGVRFFDGNPFAGGSKAFVNVVRLVRGGQSFDALIVDGQCGTADDGLFTSAPTANSATAI